MNKKIVVVLLLIIAIVVIAVVYRRSSTFDKNTQGIKQEQLPKFKLSVNSWVGYAPFYLAKEKDIFKQEGVDVDIVVMDDTAQRKAAMINGDVDGLGDTVDLLVTERDEKVPAVSVMQNDFSNGADGIVAIDSIKTIQDLKGKKIAVQKNFVSESFLNYVLKKNGLSPSDVIMIDMEAGAAGAAFVAGKVDAAVTFEPWLSKAKERKNGHVLVSSSDVPGVVVDTLSINETYLKNNQEVVKKVMRSWFKALEYYKNNQEESNLIMSKYYKISPQEFSDMISGLEWPNLDQNIAYFGKEPGKGQIFDVANTFITIFTENKQIKTVPDMSKAINQRLLLEL